MMMQLTKKSKMWITNKMKGKFAHTFRMEKSDQSNISPYKNCFEELKTIFFSKQINWLSITKKIQFINKLKKIEQKQKKKKNWSMQRFTHMYKYLWICLCANSHRATTYRFYCFCFDRTIRNFVVMFQASKYEIFQISTQFLYWKIFPYQCIVHTFFLGHEILWLRRWLKNKEKKN